MKKLLLIPILLMMVIFNAYCAFCSEVKEQFVISNGAKLYLLHFDNHNELTVKPLLKEKLSSFKLIVWPCYNKENGDLYFQATEKGKGPHVYKINLIKGDHYPESIVVGRDPSLSPDGKSLSFTRYLKQLWVLDMSTGKEFMLDDDVNTNNPAVWSSNVDLLYVDSKVNGQLKRTNIASQKTTILPYEKIIPMALSPDGMKILCINYDYEEMFQYSVASGEIHSVLKSGAFSLSGSVVWFLDNEKFIYARQSLRTWLTLSETKDLYLFTPSKRKKRLFKDIFLFGGVAIPANLNVFH